MLIMVSEMRREDKRAYNREYRANNKDRLNAYSHAYNHEYRARNRDQIRLQRSQYHVLNKEHINDKSRKYRARNKAQINECRHLYHTNKRREFFTIYGKTCIRCGMNVQGFLTDGHKNNNGGQDRLENGGPRGAFLHAIKHPDHTQHETQCYNCQRILRLNQLANKHHTDNSDKAVKKRLYNRQRHLDLRLGLFSIYGSVCMCCGETDQRILELAHKNNDGAQDRRENGGAVAVWRRAINHPDHTKYEILCANCNQGAAHNGGICPHKMNTNGW